MYPVFKPYISSYIHWLISYLSNEALSDLLFSCSPMNNKYLFPYEQTPIFLFGTYNDSVIDKNDLESELNSYIDDE